MKIKENHREKDTHKLNEMVIHVTINKTKKGMHILYTHSALRTHIHPNVVVTNGQQLIFISKVWKKIHNVNDKARGEK